LSVKVGEELAKFRSNSTVAQVCSYNTTPLTSIFLYDFLYLVTISKFSFEQFSLIIEDNSIQSQYQDI